VPLDPELATALQRLDEGGWLPLTGGPAADARSHYRRLSLARRGPDYHPERVAEIADNAAPGPGGSIPVRVYRPERARAAVTYLHGGGWVLGDLDTHDPVCRWIANRLEAVVVATDYRLAPDHPFPAPLEDAVAALEWTAQRYPSLPLGVAGDSAGASLAAGATLRARDAGVQGLAGQLLIYPATDMSASQPSVSTNAEGYFLTAADMRWFIDHYLPDPEFRTHPHANLLQAPDLSGLPPAVVATAEYDPLRDEGLAYAERLHQAGTSVHTFTGAGLTHGYLNLAELATAAAHERDAVLRAFRGLLTA
jgi:acetyl esterase